MMKRWMMVLFLTLLPVTGTAAGDSEDEGEDIDVASFVVGVKMWF